MSDTSLSTFVLSPCVASSIASSNVLHPVRRQHRPRNVPPPRLVPVQELKPFANAAHFSRLWSAWKVQQTQGLLLSVVNHVSTKSATFAAGNTRTLKEQKDHQRCSLIVTIEKIRDLLPTLQTRHLKLCNSCRETSPAGRWHQSRRSQQCTGRGRENQKVLSLSAQCPTDSWSRNTRSGR